MSTPLRRERACAAVLRSNTILMVYHQRTERSYWTLPGGAVEPGESRAEAAVRELFEETGLRGSVTAEVYCDAMESCFLVQCSADQTATLGVDPEERGKPNPMLHAVKWHALDSVREDGQVVRVLAALERLGPL